MTTYCKCLLSDSVFAALPEAVLQKFLARQNIFSENISSTSIGAHIQQAEPTLIAEMGLGAASKACNLRKELESSPHGRKLCCKLQVERGATLRVPALPLVEQTPPRPVLGANAKHSAIIHRYALRELCTACPTLT